MFAIVWKKNRTNLSSTIHCLLNKNIIINKRRYLHNKRSPFLQISSSNCGTSRQLQIIRKKWRRYLRKRFRYRRKISSAHFCWSILCVHLLQVCILFKDYHEYFFNFCFIIWIQWPVYIVIHAYQHSRAVLWTVSAG